MSLYYGTFLVTMPHEELGEQDEEFDFVFEFEAGCPQTRDDPGDPDRFEAIEAYATVSGPVNRIDHVPEAEIDRIETEMQEQLAKEHAEDFAEPEYDY
jgi:hypothetical protein